MGAGVFWSGGKWIPVLTAAALLVLFLCAGMRRFTRRWFAIHRVVGSCLRARAQVRYALSLAGWLELEARRRCGPDEFWPDLVFAAEKLEFASLKVTLIDGERCWRSPVQPLGERLLFVCPEPRFGTLEVQAPRCPLSRRPVDGCDDPSCIASRRACVSDPRVFEILAEILAEAWNKAAAEWQRRGVSLRFSGGAAKSEPRNCNGELLDQPLLLESAAPAMSSEI